MLQRLIIYAQLLRLHRPIGILLLLWPTLWALWVASYGHPDLKILVIMIAGAIIMRSAGCVINDIADREFDKAVARTKDRPLAANKISVKEAWIIFFGLCLVALWLVLQLNHFTILLAVVGLALAMIYPFTKRITHLPQFVLGAAFAWGVPMAFAAQTNHLPPVAGLMFLITWCWIVIYDTMYAMTDLPDDIKIGVKSTAILFGSATRIILFSLQLLMWLLLICLGLWLKLNLEYFLSLLLVLSLMLYQQYLIKDHKPQQCFRAFLNNNWIGLIIFIALVLAYNI